MPNQAIKRDESVDIAKGIGILFVISGHCGLTLTDFHVYSFHMPLFYFLAGFFLGKYHESSQSSSAHFIFRKTKDLLLPYFAYNVAFGVLTYLLHYININFYISTNFFDILSFQNLFIQPFLAGQHFQISCALWFVPSLFLVMCCFCLFRRGTAFLCAGIVRQALLIGILIGIYYICVNRKPFAQSPFEAIVARTLIGYCFCMLGLLYYTHKNSLNHVVVLLAAIAVYGAISIKFGTFDYSVLFNYYGSGDMKRVSLALSLSGILIILSISNLLARHDKFLHARDFAWLGKNSFHVMAVHLACFLLLNCIIATALPDSSISDITNIYFKYPNITWIYFFFSLTASCIYIKYFLIIKEKLLSLKVRYLQ